jgi:hypothetical protein
MILSDFECKKCGNIFEELIQADEQERPCPRCYNYMAGDVMAKRIISLGRVYSGNQDAPWIKSVLEVVDKDSKKPHVQEFLKNPTRSNYKKWMKGEGLRPADYTEHGGPPTFRKPPLPDTDKMAQDLYRRHRERKSLSVSL